MQITLSEDVSGWEAGDEIAIASSYWSPEQAEKRVIHSISGKEITLNQPLNFDHYGELIVRNP